VSFIIANGVFQCYFLKISMRQPNIIVLRMTDLANIKQFVLYTNQEVNFENKKPTRKKNEKSS
jgi:hypothetical protein